METIETKTVAKILAAGLLAAALAGCGGGGGAGGSTGGGTGTGGDTGGGTGGNTGGGTTGGEKKTGLFVDTAVAGLGVQTGNKADDAKEETTDFYGKFTYTDGQTPTFYIGKLKLGSATPDETKDGLVTPLSLKANGKLAAQLLQSLDVDANLSNGIYIDPRVAQELGEMKSEVDLATLDAQSLMKLGTLLATKIDNDFDGKIDIDEPAAMSNLSKAMSDFDDGWRPQNDPVISKIAKDRNATVAMFKKAQYLGILMGSLGDYKHCAIKHGAGSLYKSLYLTELLSYDLYRDLSASAVKQGWDLSILDRFVRRLDPLRGYYAEAITRYINGDVPKPGDSRGVPGNRDYGDTDLTNLYDTLYAKGTASEQDGLLAACEMEVKTELATLAAQKDTYCGTEGDAGDYLAQLKKDAQFRYGLLDQLLKDKGYEKGCCTDADSCWDTQIH